MCIWVEVFHTRGVAEPRHPGLYTRGIVVLPCGPIEVKSREE